MRANKKEVILTFQGLRFIVPKETECFWPYYGICFAGEYDPILKNIKGSDIVLDAGANIGIFTLLASRKAKIVIAIEPDPENFRYLKRNVELNDARNIILINKALSDYAGDAFISGKGPLKALSPIGNPVKVTTIDYIIRELNLTGFDILKMDIEGEEIKALNGDFLSNIKGLMVEVHNKSSYQTISYRLKMKGFNVKEWNFSSLRVLKRIFVNFGSFIMAELKTHFVATMLALKYVLGLGTHPVAPADKHSEMRLIIAWKPELLR